MKLSLSTPISSLFMVGPTYAKRLQKLGINKVEDLLYHFPFRYDDFSLKSKITQVQVGETVTVQGKILTFNNIYTKLGKKIQKAMIQDSSGVIQAIWFNQTFLGQTLKVGQAVSISGKVSWFDRKPAFISPSYEMIKSLGAILGSSPGYESLHTGRLVPVYPETYGLSSKWLRSRIAPIITKILPNLSDWMPEEIKTQHQFISLNKALDYLHFPLNQGQILAAKKRLSFDEMFLIQLSALKRKRAWQKNKPTYKFKINQPKIKDFIDKLSFKLTADQNQVLKDIFADLTKDKPMNRLLQGDVGCGKTVVASIAVYAAYLNGLQSIVMAPTEILAFQHYQTISDFLKPFGLKIALLTSSKKLSAFNLPPSTFDLIIGTHALLYHPLPLKKLGLVIIDEQHRFGVEQRAQLIKKNQAPHLLTMTATPIPRTIALTLYGDLDLSLITQMPLGRKKVKTWVVPLKKRQAAYQWIKTQLKTPINGNQAFIIYPLIEESEAETLKDIKAATQEYQHLKNKVFSNFKVGLLHGKIKTKDKEKIINNFKQQKLDILVSTPVVEVGMDIPKATIMLIEGSDRFGLAQLHQLRGRVGRSNRQSYCLLFPSNNTKATLQRLKAMEKYHLGILLAEIDLKLRGPGEVYGLKQHGFSNLKLASFTDTQLLEKTRFAAQKVIPQLSAFPLLKEKLKKVTISPVEAN